MFCSNTKQDSLTKVLMFDTIIIVNYQLQDMN